MTQGLDLGCLAMAKNAIGARQLQSRSHAMSSFKALMVHRDEDKTIRHEMTELQHGDLPAAVSYTHLTLPTILLV